jgi:hypothetical protein
VPLIDPRLKMQLDGSGLAYEVSDHYLLGIINFSNGRSQVFLVDPSTDCVGDHHDHDIISPILDLATHETRARHKAFELLKFTGTRRLGHVAVIGSTLVFKADCSAASSPQAFRSVVEAVCTTADALEKALTGGDDIF